MELEFKDFEPNVTYKSLFNLPCFICGILRCCTVPVHNNNYYIEETRKRMSEWMESEGKRIMVKGIESFDYHFSNRCFYNRRIKKGKFRVWYVRDWDVDQ